MAGPQRRHRLRRSTVPTTANVLLRHASGASSVCLFSFDSGQRRAGVLEFQGTEGDDRRARPEPVRRHACATHVGGEVDDEVDAGGRGHGTRHRRGRHGARSLAARHRPRANGELAYHVLEIMLAVEESIASGEAGGTSRSDRRPSSSRSRQTGHRCA